MKRGGPDRRSLIDQTKEKGEDFHTTPIREARALNNILEKCDQGGGGSEKGIQGFRREEEDPNAQCCGGPNKRRKE